MSNSIEKYPVGISALLTLWTIGAIFYFFANIVESLSYFGLPIAMFYLANLLAIAGLILIINDKMSGLKIYYISRFLDFILLLAVGGFGGIFRLFFLLLIFTALIFIPFGKAEISVFHYLYMIKKEQRLNSKVAKPSCERSSRGQVKSDKTQYSHKANNSNDFEAEFTFDCAKRRVQK